MNLTELQSEVLLLTKRPDLAALTLSAIKASTLKMHQADYYPKDLYEVGIAFDSAEVLQSLQYKIVFPRWRALKYIRRVDATATPPVAYGPSLEVITPEQILDGYGYQRNEVCYEAGQILQIRLASPHQYFSVGCYLHPDVATETYSSWIAADFPYSIVYDAAATVFKTIGFSEQESSMRTLVNEQIALIKISNIQAVGY
jgi:hypothetical protein